MSNLHEKDLDDDDDFEGKDPFEDDSEFDDPEADDVEDEDEDDEDED
jgi:hypothetical protein